MTTRPISKDYLLRQFQNFNSDILENRYLRQSENFSSFRGTFDTWADVPSNSNLYKEDFRNETTPRTGDYIIVNQSKDYGTEMVTVSTITHNALGKYLADDILTYTEGTLITSDIETALSGVMVEIYTYYGINKFVYYGDFEVDGKGSYVTIFGWKPTVFNIDDIPFTQNQLNNLNMNYVHPTSSNISYNNTNSGLSATNIQSAIDELSQDFDNGCTTIMNSLIAQGKTPSSNSPADIATTIANLDIVDVIKPIVVDYHYGYVNTSGAWIWEAYKDANNLDIFEIRNGYKYNVFLGNDYGNRFRSMFTDVDIRTITSVETVQGTKVSTESNAQVMPFLSRTFTSTVDGYFLISKDNAGKHGIKIFLGVMSVPSS